MDGTRESDIPSHQHHEVSEVGEDASLIVKAPDDLYDDLDDARAQIRLIAVQPSSDPDEVLRCHMKTVSLNDHPQYTALSYVWGDPTVTEEIVVNGVDQAVTTNLAAALRQLRSGVRISHTKDPVDFWPFRVLAPLLWVDAICINQKDISERSSQVRIMGRIYREALRVISWLGPEADGSAKAIAAIRQIGHEIDEISPGGDQLDWLQGYPDLLQSDEIAWSAIDLLWEREYWNRIWIVQEIVLAKQLFLVCGREMVVSDTILIVHNWAHSIETGEGKPAFIPSKVWLSLATKTLFNALPIARNQVMRNFQHQSISPLLLNLGLELRAADPRDKIYALLDLVHLNTVPDYSKSVKDLYIDVSTKYIQLQGLTPTLNLSGIENQGDSGLPSLVIDWNHPVPGSNITGSFNLGAYYEM
jgi:Heterokaryon incompatibility protein (HET)